MTKKIINPTGKEVLVERNHENISGKVEAQVIEAIQVMVQIDMPTKKIQKDTIKFEIHPALNLDLIYAKMNRLQKQHFKCHKSIVQDFRVRQQSNNKNPINQLNKSHSHKFVR